MNDKILFLKQLNQMKGTKPGSRTEAISKQAKLWTMFAKISPIIFIIVMGLLWSHNVLQLNHILWTAGIGFVTTAVIWWFWTVHTIGQLAGMVKQADDGVNEALGDLKEIRSILKDIRNNQ